MKINIQTILNEIDAQQRTNQKGVIPLYKTYLPFLKKAEQSDDIETIIIIQRLKVMVGRTYLFTSYFAAASEIFKEVIRIFEEKELVNKAPYEYNSALEGSLKCEIYFQNTIESERIVKKKINETYIENIANFKELTYESNQLYWSKKVWLFTLTGLFLLLIGLGLLFLKQSMLQYNYDSLCIGTGLLLYFYGRIYRLLNQDYIAITPFEFIILKNDIRAYLNKKYGFRLGEQLDI